MRELEQNEIEKLVEMIGHYICGEKHISDTIRDCTLSIEEKQDLNEYSNAIKSQRQDLTLLLFPEEVYIPSEVWCSLKHDMGNDINYYEKIQRAEPNELEFISDLANRHHVRLVKNVIEIRNGKYQRPEKKEEK